MKREVLHLELIWAQDCPHIDLAREHLRIAMKNVGLVPSWQEWDRDDVSCPEHARRFGSPTILVNGKDSQGQSPEGNDCCRLYQEEGAYIGAPSIGSLERVIVMALSDSGGIYE